MIKLLKSGNWALEGVNVVEMLEGAEQTFGPVEDCKLVDAGWAEWVKAEKADDSSMTAGAGETQVVKARKPGAK